MDVDCSPILDGASIQEAGEAIFAKGDPGQSLVAVARGSVKVSVLSPEDSCRLAEIVAKLNGCRAKP